MLRIGFNQVQLSGQTKISIDGCYAGSAGPTSMVDVPCRRRTPDDRVMHSPIAGFLAGQRAYLGAGIHVTRR